MTPEYARLLAGRLGTLVDSLIGLQADLLTAVAPPASVQRHLTDLFCMPITDDAGADIQRYQQISPGVHFGFEDSSSARLIVRPKQNYTASPETCLNSLDIAFSGASRWFTLEAMCSWTELAAAERYQLSLTAEPDRAIRCQAVIRLPQRDGSFSDHGFASLELQPGRRAAVSAGELKLPDLGTADTSKAPMLLLFFGTEDALRLRLDYINIYFA